MLEFAFGVASLRAPLRRSERGERGLILASLSNNAFELIEPDLITGIISEIGIYRPEVFVEEMERHYSFLFKD